LILEQAIMKTAFRCNRCRNHGIPEFHFNYNSSNIIKSSSRINVYNAVTHSPT